MGICTRNRNPKKRIAAAEGLLSAKNQHIMRDILSQPLRQLKSIAGTFSTANISVRVSIFEIEYRDCLNNLSNTKV